MTMPVDDISLSPKDIGDTLARKKQMNLEILEFNKIPVDEVINAVTKETPGTTLNVAIFFAAENNEWPVDFVRFVFSEEGNEYLNLEQKDKVDTLKEMNREKLEIRAEAATMTFEKTSQ